MSFKNAHCRFAVRNQLPALSPEIQFNHVLNGDLLSKCILVYLCLKWFDIFLFLPYLWISILPLLLSVISNSQYMRENNKKKKRRRRIFFVIGDLPNARVCHSLGGGEKSRRVPVLLESSLINPHPRWFLDSPPMTHFCQIMVQLIYCGYPAMNLPNYVFKPHGEPQLDHWSTTRTLDIQQYMDIFNHGTMKIYNSCVYTTRADTGQRSAV